MTPGERTWCSPGSAPPRATAARGLEHAKRAQRILSADNPASISFFKAAALVKELDAG
ncbi:MAG: hypothetical protein ACRDOH_30715 [Streptosporangiaceae bacterium]